VPEATDYAPYLGLGACAEPDGVSFRVHAAGVSRVEVVLYAADGQSERGRLPLTAEEHAIFSGTLQGETHGTLYRIALDGTPQLCPYARYLPFGLDGPAMVYAAQTARRTPHRKRPLSEYVIYELHVGTFTDAGTFQAAIPKLRHLRELGVTALELMPLSAFPGARGWGYDGVAHFAPFAPYGTPDDLRAFIDHAHELGLSVLLDVVYNHFGPAGCTLGAFSPHYFSSEADNPWGSTLAFGYAPLRAFVVDNARFWIEEVGFDGLRLDAVHAIRDSLEPTIVETLVDEVQRALPQAVIIAEDDRNDPAIVESVGCDAFWADDFHHVLRVLLTGEHAGYYAAYSPASVEALARTIRDGVYYRGQANPVTGKPRGKPMPDLPAQALVYCIENHDQIGNRATGDRLLASVSLDAYCAASMLLLFLPMTPLMFMGQEWASERPFPFFCDHDPALGDAIRAGRKREFEGMHADTPPDPQAEATFRSATLDWERIHTPDGARVLALYRRMLHLRNTHPVLGHHGRAHMRVWAEGPVLHVVRSLNDEDLLLLVNFGDAEQPYPPEHPALGAEQLLRTDGRAPGAALAPMAACVMHAYRVERVPEP